MRGILASCLIAASAAVVLGQQPSALLSKAPPDIDEALRARVKDFYELQKLGKFRASEAFVCEDSKDAYYAADKRQWTSVDIQRVDYADGFKDAKVTTALGSEFTNRAGRMPVIFPYTSVWKVEDGKWCYFLPPPGSATVQTPFGPMMGGNKGYEVATPPGKPIDPAILAKAVRMSRSELQIPGKGESHFEIELENTIQGNVSLRFLPPPIEGLVAKLTKSELGPGEKTTLTVTFIPGPKAPPATSVLPIRAEPIGQQLSLKLFFGPQPER